jgi:ribulose-bisphosphate carboxylase large chain
MTSTVLDPRRIEADYLIETSIDPRVAAEIIAGEQSSGTFRAVPRETPQLKERAAARIEKIEELETVNAASLLGATRPAKGQSWRRAKVTLTWPLDNIGPSLPNLMSTIAGNLFELQSLSGIRLLDVRLPIEFSQQDRNSV